MIRSIDIPRLLAPKRFIDYTNLSDGQTLLELIDRRLDLLSSYGGDSKGDIQKAKNLLFRHSSNLHGFTPYFGVASSQTEQYVARYIKQASKQKRNYKGISSDTLGMGIQSIVPKLDCQKAYRDAFNEYMSSPQIQNELDQARNEYDERSIIEKYEREAEKLGQKAEADCKEKNTYVGIINDLWEENSHHALYEFVTRPQQAKGNADVSSKKLKHQLYLSSIHSLTGISRPNLVEWTHNGIVASNIANGGSYIDPSQTIDLLIDGGRGIANGQSISSVLYDGGPAPGFVGNGFKDGIIINRDDIQGIADWVVLLIVVVVSALVKAIMASIEVKKKLKLERQILADAIESMGTKEVSGDIFDWTDFADTDGNINPEKIKNSAIAIALSLVVGGIAYKSFIAQK